MELASPGVQRVRRGARTVWLLARPGVLRHPRSELIALPFLLIVAITLIDLLYTGSIHLGDLLIVVPVMTAWYAGPRVTGLVSLAAVAALVAIYAVRHSASPPQMAALIITAVFSTSARYLSRRHQREITQVRTVSEAAQRAIVPPYPANSARYAWPRHTWRPKTKRISAEIFTPLCARPWGHG